MNNRNLGILAAVAAVMVLWAVVQAHFSGGRRAAPTGPTYLIQGLDPAEIDSITVGKGKNPIKIARQEGKFVVTNKSNYPADTKQINDLISKSLDIKTGDLCTSDPKNHEDLQVTEDKAKSIVKFFKADGSLLAGVVVGQSKESGQGTYVRLASSDDVYTAEEAPWFHDRAIDFVNQELTSVKREDVNSVTVTTPEGTYALRPGKGSDNVLLVNMPADKKLKDADAKSVFSALTEPAVRGCQHARPDSGTEFRPRVRLPHERLHRVPAQAGPKGREDLPAVRRRLPGQDAGDAEPEPEGFAGGAQEEGSQAPGKGECPEVRVAAQRLDL